MQSAKATGNPDDGKLVLPIFLRGNYKLNFFHFRSRTCSLHFAFCIFTFLGRAKNAKLQNAKRKCDVSSN